MRLIRILGLIIAAIIVLDFVIVGRARHDLALTAAPALAGAIVMSFVAWRDAASPAQRRLLAGCTCVLAAGLALALALSLYRPSSFQPVLMAVLLACAATLAWRAIRLSRKRRQLHAITHYLES